ncbi:hypothetical protein BDCR2A_00666 [Borrelia duttonii CR2A]|uniref:Uncharacterized protein n=1 Tax=Borrelia duttonii CR2A TaxID=1432657 RepID=W6TJ54_9SPIR|nr:hypothetical protein BDCR2A_00666 [Borrelia duttonii CR2A]
MSDNTNVILKKYLQDLILELKKLKAILEFENTKITQGIIDILEITNPKKRSNCKFNQQLLYNHKFMVKNTRTNTRRN